MAGLVVVNVLVITSARFRIALEALYLLPAALAVERALVWVWVRRGQASQRTSPESAILTARRGRDGGEHVDRP